MKELKHTGREGDYIGPLGLSANVAKRGVGWEGGRKDKMTDIPGLLCPRSGVALAPATGAILEDRHSRHGHHG